MPKILDRPHRYSARCRPSLGLAVTDRYQSDMRAVREHIDSLGRQVVETDCGPIEYARIGDGYPVVVVLFDRKLQISITII